MVVVFCKACRPETVAQKLYINCSLSALVSWSAEHNVATLQPAQRPFNHHGLVYR